MESFVARLAVYNVAGFLRCISSHWFIIVISLGCVVVAYLYFKEAERTPQPISEKEETKPNYEENRIKNFVHDWLKLYDMPLIQICRLWIDPVNKILSGENDSFFLRVHSIEVEAESSISSTKYETINSSTTEKSCIHFSVQIPVIKVNLERRRAGTSVWDSLTMHLCDFSLSLLCKLEHICADLLKVNAYAASEPQFTVNTVITNDFNNASRRLAEAIRAANVNWSPSHSNVPVSSVEYSVENDGETTVGPKLSSTESENNVELISEPTTQTHMVHRGSIQSSSFGLPESSEFPLRNASSVEYTPGVLELKVDRRSTGPKNLDRVFQRRLFGGVLNGTSSSSDQLPSSTATSGTDDSISATPVVLAYNEKLRQSMAARQVPRKSVGQLVRSASYYGENRSKVDSEEDSPATYEPEPIGDPAPVVLPKDMLESSSSKEQALPAEQRVGTQQSQQEPKKYKSLTPTYTMDSIQGVSESPHLSTPPHHRTSVSHADSPSTPESGSAFLASKKLLVKVVKAEDLALKATSNAYCVVELDEPYQRHTTHCSSAGQLFWDQHLLFDLNTNSKRVALEVFELSKRRKSVSKGRAEQLLTSLLCPTPSAEDMDQDSILSNLWDASEPRRRLPLHCTFSGSTMLSSSSTGPALSSVLAVSSASSGAASTAPGSPTAHLNPTITAEFHLMEKANEEALAARQRMTTSNPTPVQRAYSTRGNAQSFSAQDSPILGAALGVNSLSHSTSLEFGHTKFILPKHANVIAEGQTVEEFHSTTTPKGVITVTTTTTSPIRSQPPGSEELKSGEVVAGPGAGPSHSSVPLSPTLRTAQLFSPVPLRRAQMVSYDIGAGAPVVASTGAPSPGSFRSKPPGLEPTAEDGSEDNELPKSPLSLDQSFGPFDGGELTLTGDPASSGFTTFSKTQSTERTSLPRIEKSGDGLQRTDSLLKRSNLIGADESADATRRILLPYPDSDFDLSLDDSNAPSGQSSCSSRSQSLASRLRTSRLLGSGMLKPGKRSGDESVVSSSTNSLALLGPSRQLAGVVASMSTLPTDSGKSPSSAAALASAVAVAGATGSWQQPNTSLTGGSRPSARPGVEVVSAGAVKPRSRDEVPESDPPMRYVPPAASVAAELPGTYTALGQPRRSDASNLSLFRLFRHKKKRFRSVGAEKLLYLENNDLEEFDAMSTEGYYRIVQDADPSNPSPPTHH